MSKKDEKRAMQNWVNVLEKADYETLDKSKTSILNQLFLGRTVLFSERAFSKYIESRYPGLWDVCWMSLMSSERKQKAGSRASIFTFYESSSGEDKPAELGLDMLNDQTVVIVMPDEMD